MQLARLSLRKIEIYLIDNVFKNLTEKETKEVMGHIKLLEKQPGTFLIATKDEKIAKELTERGVKIKFGSILKE